VRFFFPSYRNSLVSQPFLNDLEEGFDGFLRQFVEGLANCRFKPMDDGAFGDPVAEIAWKQQEAKQVLASREIKELLASVREWEGRDVLEAVALMVWCGLEDPHLLERLCASADPRCRADAARVAGRWARFDLLAVSREAGVEAASKILLQDKPLAISRNVFQVVAASEGSPQLLVGRFERGQANQEQGKRLRAAWIAAGVVPPQLAARIDDLAGGTLAGMTYSEDLVRELVAAAKSGDPDKGGVVFTPPTWAVPLVIRSATPAGSSARISRPLEAACLESALSPRSSGRPARSRMDSHSRS